MADDIDEAGAPLYVWIGLSLIAAVSFWTQVRSSDFTVSIWEDPNR